jgi:uncharacterized protein (DUF2236 family)
MAHVERMADIAAEAVLIAGGGRAILLQLAHPSIAMAIDEHSDFANDPLRRLRHTMAYVYSQVFGTPRQAAATRAWVDRAHAAVESASYSAVDPGLQLWVAATLYDSAIEVHETVYGSLPEHAADRIYREYAILGTALQVPASAWPVDRTAFAAYFAATLDGLEVSDVARAQAARLLDARRAPLWLRAGMPLGRLVTAGLLPAGIRSQFGLPWSAARERRLARTWAVVRAIYPRMPARLRHAPRDRSLRAIDRALTRAK